MVDEIHDNENAEIAAKAAKTGHLVLSTLHTNLTAEMFIRMTQMGIEHHLIASNLTLIIDQKLVRRLCLHCRQPAPSPFKPPAKIRTAPLHHYLAVECEHCCAGDYG